MDETENKVPITEDMKRFSNICYAVGYMASHIDEDWSDAMSADIVEYITHLFVAKR